MDSRFLSFAKRKCPSARKLGNEHPDNSYQQIMKRIFENIENAGGDTFSIDRATENIAKSRSNVILHTPTPLFVALLRSYLQPETTPTIVKNGRHSKAIGRKIQDQILNQICF